MRPITTYAKLTDNECREELVFVTSALAGGYNELSACLVDQQREYLDAYVRSAGGSVAAKNREAQYNVEDLTRQIIELRAKLNSLTLCRDLLVFLMLHHKPGDLPFPALASFDGEGLIISA